MQILATPQNDSTASMASLSDDALLASTRSLLGRERRITAELVAHLGEIEARALCQREGYSSLFVYCRDALGLSEHEAYGRIEAARAARKFPLVLDLLRGGSITITTIGLLARHLTPENHRAILESARGRKKVDVEEIVARLRPAADVPATLRKLPVAPTAPALAVGPAGTGAARALDQVASAAATGTAAVRPQLHAPTPPVPLSPDRYKYQLTIDKETRDLLWFAKDMLRHADPGGDDAALLKRALELLVSDLARKRFGTSLGRAKASPAASGSRHIPAHVKRVVFVRDRGRCAFVGGQCHRCDERAFLEFHHLKPYAVGGVASPENIELRCRGHNQYEARLYFARQDEGRGLATEAAPWSLRRDTVPSTVSGAAQAAVRSSGSSP